MGFRQSETRRNKAKQSTTKSIKFLTKFNTAWRATWQNRPKKARDGACDPTSCRSCEREYYMPIRSKWPTMPNSNMNSTAALNVPAFYLNRANFLAKKI